jgi:hypothetical protein
METRCDLSFIRQVKRRAWADVVDVPDWAVVLKRHAISELRNKMLTQFLFGAAR